MSSEAKLTTCIVTFILLVNADVEKNQLVSVLAAAAPRQHECGVDTDSDNFLKILSFESVAGVFQQFDLSKEAGSKETTSLGISANNSSMKSNQNRNRGRLSPEELAQMKARSVCKLCSKVGH